MSDDERPKRSLSEISHLFLSSVRDRQTGGAARPRRRPPAPGESARPQTSIDLTPEEFAQVFGEAEPAARDGAEVMAILGAHLNGHQLDRVREYARHLAAAGERVGVIQVDPADFRVTCFDPPGRIAVGHTAPAAETIESFDPRRMSQMLEELNFDVDRWLIVLPAIRAPEARGVLRQIDHWVLLSTCDHDGIVSCYRTLKGLCDLHHPKLSLALLDVQDEPQATRVFRKLESVCCQFLHWTLHSEPSIRKTAAAGIGEQVVMSCRPMHDKSQLAAGVQWQVLSGFLSVHRDRADSPRPGCAATAAAPTISAMSAMPVPSAGLIAEGETVNEPSFDATPSEIPVADFVIPMPVPAPSPSPSPSPAIQSSASVPAGQTGASAPATQSGASAPAISIGASAPATQSGGSAPPPQQVAPTNLAAERVAPPTVGAAASIPTLQLAQASEHESDVIELSGNEDDAEAILDAVMQNSSSNEGLIACPVRPPGDPAARLAVNRERRLVLVAAARKGLGDLRAIAQGYRWLIENRPLLGMAMPQFAIDTHQFPALRLLVDQADLTAELLGPLLESGNVSVRAYRRLRWAGRRALLLEAA